MYNVYLKEEEVARYSHTAREDSARPYAYNGRQKIIKKLNKPAAEKKKMNKNKNKKKKKEETSTDRAKAE